MMTEQRSFSHDPVMLDEIVAAFETVPAGVVYDGTLGGAGHSSALLAARSDLSILGIDRDPAALAVANERLAKFGDRAMTYRGRFDEVGDAMVAHGVASLSGALFDLGVSSPQLDWADRGFSYRLDGPLDMRMDADSSLSADDVVNFYAEGELIRVLRQYGDERYATRIAARIVQARPVRTTTELADIITAAIPAPARRTGGHPAKRSFQAIRIEVNGELDALLAALDATIEALAPGGRLVVLSYHSGEDRIVKRRIRLGETGGCECPQHLPCGCGAQPTLTVVRRIAKQPTADEQASNRRATSARLRVAQKLTPTTKGTT